MISLQPITRNDLDRITELCQDKEISDMTLNIPHPYSKEDASFFYENIVQKDKSHQFAIYHNSEPQLIGVIGLQVDIKKPWMAEIGYWMGKEYRNKGYMTDSLRKMIDFGFSELNLRRIYCTHDPNNTASGKVMQKAGMTYEGLLKSTLKKGNLYLDSCYYSVIYDSLV